MPFYYLANIVGFATIGLAMFNLEFYMATGRFPEPQALLQKIGIVGLFTTFSFGLLFIFTTL